jgi:hypothetical protein
MRKVIIMLFVVSLVFSGCAIFKGSAKEETSQPKGAVPNQAFYSFPDIPVPQELNFVRDKSFIYETPMMKVGVLVLSGNVELQSLENYFRINMVKNGWKFVNSFKFKDISLNFVKEDKTCNIKMSREAFNADVEIWVGPSDKGSTQKGNGPK